MNTTLEKTPSLSTNSKPDLRQGIEEISDKLCLAVDGNFDFTITTANADEALHKLAMLINFLLDSARRGLKEVQEKSKRLESLNRAVIDTTRKIGMAEIASNVLHNVGNVLNTINVSINLLKEKKGFAELDNMVKFLNLLNEHADNLADFIAKDPRGTALVKYIPVLKEKITAESAKNNEEIDLIIENVNNIKNIIATQQQYAKNIALEEKVSVKDLIEDLLKIQSGRFKKHGLTITKDLKFNKEILIDRHNLISVISNIVNNSIDSFHEITRTNREINIKSYQEGDNFCIEITDNGVGIEESQIKNLFKHGYTTKKDGHGFGLHSCALTINDMKGTITCSSPGKNQGATFKITLPYKN